MGKQTTVDIVMSMIAIDMANLMLHLIVSLHFRTDVLNSQRSAGEILKTAETLVVKYCYGSHYKNPLLSDKDHYHE